MDQNILEFFKRAVEVGRLAHSYLFYGPNKTGKKDTAFWLADFLKINGNDILYITSERQPKIERPDIVYLVPAKDKEGGTITIDQIRQAKRHLSLSAYNSPYKFAIIDRAELMNIAAANALLKTLEEPYGNTILILITSKPDLLPETIISRLQEVKFRDIPLSKVSKGFLDKEYTDILKKPLNDIFKYIEKVTKNSKEKKDDTEIFSILDSWLFWYRDLMITNSKYADIVKEIIKIKDLISTTNVNKRLALENLVLCTKS